MKIIRKKKKPRRFGLGTRRHINSTTRVGIVAAVAAAFYLSDRVQPGRSVLWGERL